MVKQDKAIDKACKVLSEEITSCKLEKLSCSDKDCTFCENFIDSKESWKEWCLNDGKTKLDKVL